MSDEPFGRQPQPVRVQVTGEHEDVAHWTMILAKRAEYKGDLVQMIDQDKGFFVIYPRAVND